MKFQNGNAAGRKHGMSTSPEYQAWKAMKWRCNPKNKAQKKYYFLRGISVWPEWAASFTAFFDYIGHMPEAGMEVDRIDGTRGYRPGNVRWATRRDQMANTEHALKIDISGVIRCASEWARVSGVPLTTILYRARRGWPPAEILSTKRFKHRVGRCA